MVILGATLWITSSYGIGVSPDSVFYLTGAKNLLRGNGFTYQGEPITHFPPLYSIFLAGLASLIRDRNIIQAARLLNALLFSINTSLVSLTVYWTCNHNFWAAIAANMLFIICAPLLSLHSMALSEPLFFALLLLGMALLVRYWVNPSLSLLVFSSFLFGISSITRYIGIAFLPATLCLVIFRQYKNGIKHIFCHSLIGIAGQIVPFGSVILHNLVVAHSATNRSFVFHPLTYDHIHQAIVALHDYLFPIMRLNISKASLAWLGLSGHLGTNFVLLSLKNRGYNRECGKLIFIPFFIVSAFYIFFLLVSISFFDFHTPLDFRILSPALILSTLGVFSGTWATFKGSWCRKICFHMLMVFSTLMIIIKGPPMIDMARWIYQNGQGFTNREWQQSEGVRYVRSLPQTITVYSNAWDALTFLVERQCLPIPSHTLANENVPNPEYELSLAKMCEGIEKTSSVLIYFDRVNWRWYLPTRKTLEEKCQMRVLERLSDAVVYGNR